MPDSCKPSTSSRRRLSKIKTLPSALNEDSACHLPELTFGEISRPRVHVPSAVFSVNNNCPSLNSNISFPSALNVIGASLLDGESKPRQISAGVHAPFASRWLTYTSSCVIRRQKYKVLLSAEITGQYSAEKLLMFADSFSVVTLLRGRSNTSINVVMRLSSVGKNGA